MSGEQQRFIRAGNNAKKAWRRFQKPNTKPFTVKRKPLTTKKWMEYYKVTFLLTKNITCFFVPRLREAQVVEGILTLCLPPDAPLHLTRTKAFLGPCSKWISLIGCTSFVFVIFFLVITIMGIRSAARSSITKMIG